MTLYDKDTLQRLRQLREAAEYQHSMCGALFPAESAFYRAAHAALPALLDEVERLREQVALAHIHDREVDVKYDAALVCLDQARRDLAECKAALQNRQEQVGAFSEQLDTVATERVAIKVPCDGTGRVCVCCMRQKLGLVRK